MLNRCVVFSRSRYLHLRSSRKGWKTRKEITFRITWIKWVSQEMVCKPQSGTNQQIFSILWLQPFNCQLTLKHKTVRHLLILLKKHFVPMICLLYEPEQKASARRSVCIKGYESIFLESIFLISWCFPMHVVRGHVHSFRACKIRQLWIRWLSSQTYLHRRPYYKYINYCLILFNLYSNSMLLFYDFY